MPDVTCEVDCHCMLGEGPLWDDRTGIVWWVDILTSKLHSFDPKTKQHIERELEDPLTSICKRESGGFVGTGYKGFVLLDNEAQVIRYLGDVEPDIATNRFNDGKVDHMGRLWAGTMDFDCMAKTGALYCLDTDLTWSRHDADHAYIVTNGPAFSPDGKTFYHTDTFAKQVFAFDLNDDGSLSNKSLFIQLNDGEGFADGMTVDNTGNLYVNHYGGSRITRFDPSGRKINHYPMPASCVTSCTFGGVDLDTLYITTATQGVEAEDRWDDEPLAGNLFSIKVDAVGLPASSFKG